jgi:DNA-binding HxlR family transcriptional regulator
MEDLRNILGIIGGGKIKVFNHIVKNTNTNTNEFYGIIKDIRKETGVSEKTIVETIGTLTEQGFMIRKTIGTYIINPEMIMKGNNLRQAIIVFSYNKALSASNEKQLELTDNQKKLMEALDQDFDIEI